MIRAAASAAWTVIMVIGIAINVLLFASNIGSRPQAALVNMGSSFLLLLGLTSRE